MDDSDHSHLREIPAYKAEAIVKEGSESKEASIANQRLKDIGMKPAAKKSKCQQAPQVETDVKAAISKNKGAENSLDSLIVSLMQKHMLNLEEMLDRKVVKLDEMWKPLLRSFRTFHRNKLKQEINRKKATMTGKSGNLTEKYNDICLKYLLEIGATESLVENEHHLNALIVLVMRVSPKNMKASLKNLPKVR